MKLNIARRSYDLPFELDRTAKSILNTQRKSGEIPWSRGNITDPWDMVESIMGLSVAGYLDQARAGFSWLAEHQLGDGSWYSNYRDGKPTDRTRETHMSAYIAVGVYHHFLVTGDMSFLHGMWDTVRSAIDFSLSLQTGEGVIYWAKSPEGHADPVSLLTGASSIFMSIKCALRIARILGHRQPAWQPALEKLGDAIRTKPHLFDPSKARYSMDWFYPILCGAVTGIDARRRIARYWEKFVVMGMGVKCVSDSPWVTFAESSELILALDAMGNTLLARGIFGWIVDKRYEDGAYWCGETYPDAVVWPEEKMTWTNAVVLMAADALYGITAAGKLFTHEFWQPARELIRLK
ncbi:MAG: phenyltransferase domain-containing protein [Desulfobacterales bacterium]|nr:phenyltransferase domain-containing protein [Desulfobacterales bacterium]